MAEHTPGPWHVSTAANRKPTVVSPDLLGIAACILPHGKYGEWEEDLANARLISAAPELFRCLKAVVEEMDIILEKEMIFGDGLLDWLEAARAAIAKAEGRNG